MPHKSLSVSVEPKVLIWARESIGRSVEDVAKRLKISENTINSWESGQKKPSLVQLEKLAKIVYKRPLAAFFLHALPVEPPLPSDFRTLPRDKKIPFSPKTRLAIRRAQRMQSVATELTENITRVTFFRIGMANLSDNPEEVATKIREQLKINIQTQFGWKKEEEAFTEWEKVVEKCGILVFQMGMPIDIDKVRGFSLTENKIPTIVLNSKDSIRGRIFSLFHEYAHLLVNESGICDMEEQDYLPDKDKSIEKFCNHFAGAFLVPKDTLLNHGLVKSNSYISEWSDEILEELAKNFKVSQEVILRRLLILKLSTVDFYKKKRQEWGKIARGQKGWGKPNPSKKCVQENGVPFTSLVMDAQRKGKITYSDVADYLGVRIKYLPKVEQLIGEKA